MRRFRFAFLIPLAACADTTDRTDQHGRSDDDPATQGFRVQIANIAPWTMLKSGTQAVHVDGELGPLAPGEAFEVTFTANQGQAINFATMLGESNDWFFAPGPEGIPLFSEGKPTTGDVTRLVRLWDAGTEFDQEPAVGNATAPRQPSPDFGEPDPDPGISAIAGTVVLDTGAPFSIPAVSEMIRVTLAQETDQRWILRIENVSSESTLCTSMGLKPIHLSPLAWSLHIMPAPLFDPGKPDRDQGLERIAEDGAPDALGKALAALSGFHTPLSPGVFAVHSAGTPLFTPGQPDFDQGLERIAEDGDANQLGASLEANAEELGLTAHGVFDTPRGAEQPGPAMPGEAYSFEVNAIAGSDRLSFATMFGMSNDWFFATSSEGLVIEPCDVTTEVVLYDAGTEIDQEPAIGPFTAPQQDKPDTGPADPEPLVRAVDRIRYPVPASLHVRVTIEPAGE
jgi:hypothetical protein